MENKEQPSKEFLVLLKEVVENRVLIESLYKSVGVTDEELKKHIEKIEPITTKILDDYLKTNFSKNK